VQIVNGTDVVTAGGGGGGADCGVDSDCTGGGTKYSAIFCMPFVPCSDA
jgi:hypothetical protein